MRRAEKLRWLILAAQREGNRMLATALRPLGLTPSQSEVLRLLGDHAPLTLTGLGELLVCESGTNPSRLVDRTVELGLVDRATPDVGDRRQVILQLTAKGRSLEESVRQIEERMYVRLVSEHRALLEAHLAKLDELFASLQYRAFRGGL